MYMLMASLIVALGCSSPFMQHDHEVAQVEEEPASAPAEAAPAFDHSPWNAIVSTYVTESERFDYAALAGNAEHMALLEAYREALSEARMTGWTDPDKLAFWINAYNANTVAGVLANEPLDSVLNVEGFFDATEYSVAGRTLTLNDLENEQIRRTFGEPRIHFAVNCASIGCPPIRADVFTGEHLERQLEEQTVAFVRATTRYDANTATVTVSQIFEWFADDFASAGGVREFIASRLEDESAASALRSEVNALAYEPYDWNVNRPE